VLISAHFGVTGTSGFAPPKVLMGEARAKEDTRLDSDAHQCDGARRLLTGELVLRLTGKRTLRKYCAL
jgi:hypothetical protein